MGVKLLLSKSRIVDGLCCEKKVYLNIHQPELKSPITPQQQKVFDQGNEVGVWARNEFPGGFLITAPHWDIKDGLKQTSAAITNGVNTIYEAVFESGGLHCRVDVLSRKSSSDPWTLIEVKSGTSAKEEYILDAAIQAYILKDANVKLNAVKIMHINSECVFPDLSNLFERVDISRDVIALESEIEKSVQKIKAVLKNKSVPRVAIGRHCESPYSCDFKEICWKTVESPSVFDLPNCWKLFDLGFIKLSDVDEDSLAKNQIIPFEVVSTGKRYINSNGIKKSLKDFTPPFFHLDFETIGPAIPRFEGVGPYSNTPVQFSLDIQDKPLAKPRHFEYLHDDDSDPREMIAKKLVEWIPAKGGTVIAYNAAFEKGVILKLAEQFPKYKKHLLSIADRLKDPLPVVRGHVYDVGFAGSFSIKTVAPSLLGPEWDYSKLEVSDGKLAQIAFDEMISPNTSPKEKSAIRKSLLQYCAQDTAAIVALMDWLYQHQTD